MSYSRSKMVAAQWVLCLTAVYAGENNGWLRVKAKPSGAGIYLDDKYLGPAANFRIARKYQVTPGSHSIRIADAGYQSKTQPIVVAAGTTLTLDVTLEPAAVVPGPYGKVHVSHPDKFAAVSIDGYFIGFVDQVDNPFEYIRVTAGDHLLAIAPTDGRSPVDKLFRIKANETQKLRFP